MSVNRVNTIAEGYKSKGILGSWVDRLKSVLSTSGGVKVESRAERRRKKHEKEKGRNGIEESDSLLNRLLHRIGGNLSRAFTGAKLWLEEPVDVNYQASGSEVVLAEPSGEQEGEVQEGEVQEGGEQEGGEQEGEVLGKKSKLNIVPFPSLPSILIDDSNIPQGLDESQAADFMQRERATNEECVLLNIYFWRNGKDSYAFSDEHNSLHIMSYNSLQANPLTHIADRIRYSFDRERAAEILRCFISLNLKQLRNSIYDEWLKTSTKREMDSKYDIWMEKLLSYTAVLSVKGTFDTEDRPKQYLDALKTFEQSLESAKKAFEDSLNPDQGSRGISSVPIPQTQEQLSGGSSNRPIIEIPKELIISTQKYLGEYKTSSVYIEESKESLIDKALNLNKYYGKMRISKYVTVEGDKLIIHPFRISRVTSLTKIIADIKNGIQDKGIRDVYIKARADSFIQNTCIDIQRKWGKLSLNDIDKRGAMRVSRIGQYYTYLYSIGDEKGCDTVNDFIVTLKKGLSTLKIYLQNNKNGLKKSTMKTKEYLRDALGRFTKSSSTTDVQIAEGQGDIVSEEL